MTPQELLHSPQARHLCPYAREEMFHHSLVYFIGTGSQKKQADPDIYLVVRSDHLAYRYEVVDALGNGSFGQVLNCRDHRTGESVAIKLIRNKKRFHHQDLVYGFFFGIGPKGENHVVKMTEHFYFCSHLCIAMELLSINLYELIKANRLMTMSSYLMWDHNHRIVRCGLEPELTPSFSKDVLLKHPPKSAIKVIDFGSTCFEHEKIYTYTQSQCYPSLEVILGINYHVAIDMWNPGCILAELYTGFPIFPGENEQEQLSCMMEVLGPPNQEVIDRNPPKRLLFDNSGAPRSVVNFKGQRRGPERRMKPQAALPYSVLKTGRRSKVTSPSPTTTTALLPSSSLSESRTSKVTETPKKSQISALTPLTVRSSRTVVTDGVNATPVRATSMGPLSRPYRSSRHSFCRTLGGFAVATAK
ncbi:kinase-like domain-containing protein [Pisolithus orientalis]|uniref:kinase-like domain-containing protein n=1 Tax=Pisolithus orientalis TaxID=936130 RepID=UPI002223FAB1|nr:kinase-like domain-containing protein [Pisolithus orientalis]KAI5988299.1 kinase-like domain-containing protein [Pisolithus orientalis]